MARNFSTTVIHALTDVSVKEAFLFLLDVSHSQIETVRIVNNTQDIVSGGNTYTAFPFRMVLPAETEDQTPSFRVTIDNASQLLIDEVRTLAGSSESVLANVKLVMASDPNTILEQWSQFTLKNVRYNAETMTFDLTIEDYLRVKYPGKVFSPATTPGLY